VSLSDVLLGKPIATDEAETESVGALAGVPVLGLDALASAAYGPEALLTVLLPLGVAGLPEMIKIVPLLVLVLALLFVSYRQTISAYPSGGGAYTVASENLGARPSLVAAASLALDYILNVAVAIAAGVGALVSVVPALLPYTLPLCLGMLALLTLVNLRGFRTTGLVFMAPTYAFITLMAVVIGVGIVRVVMHGWHPEPIAAPPRAHGVATVSLWLLVRAFANGCTALTGVEAISNGIPIFREPRVVHARRALAIIAGVLAFLLVGEAALCWAFRVLATPPAQPGFRSLLSSLSGAIVGHGVLYHVTMASVLAVLLLSANTSFADFPRLCRILAGDGYLPEPFVHRNRRLAFSTGIVVLAAISAVLLIVFGGVTDALIPLFAIGALAAFTMSQLGMVGHWRRLHKPKPLAVNLIGAVATGITLVVVLFAKLTEGAWLSVLIVVGMYVVLVRVRHHYDVVAAEVATTLPLLGPIERPIAVVPMRRWNAMTRKALRLALQLAGDVTAVQVITHDRQLEDLTPRWDGLVGGAVKLETVRAELRDVRGPLLAYVQRIAAAYPHSQIVVIIPELIESRWYHLVLHNRTSGALRRLLLRKGGPQIVVVIAPWHLRQARRERRLARARRATPR
jgi:amino acid transporter